MEISQYSKNNILHTMQRWSIEKEYVDPLYNYLIFGFDPGSFWRFALANDFMNAISRSHPTNRISSLANIVGWINECLPKQCYGSYSNVKFWIYLDESSRRDILEKHNLIFTEEQEIILALKQTKSDEPLFL